MGITYLRKQSTISREILQYSIKPLYLDPNLKMNRIFELYNI